MEGTIVWRPDTCDCAIEVTSGWEFVASVASCRLHVGASLADVLAHNRSFNETVYTDDDARDAAKAAERERIRDL